MKRHFTKDEILQKHKEMMKLKKTQLSAPHSGMAIMLNYILWEKYGYRHERLSKFNESVNEYIRKYEDVEIEIKNLRDKLFEKAEFKIEFIPATEKDICVNKNNKYLYNLAKQEIEINNQINEYSTLYILSALNVMIDNKFGKSRLEKLKNEMNQFLKDIDSGLIKTMEIHRLLAENGVLIEIPNYK